MKTLFERMSEAQSRDSQSVWVKPAIEFLGATPADGVIPGLWNVPGYPELTTGQLIDIYMQRRPRR